MSKLQLFNLTVSIFYLLKYGLDLLELPVYYLDSPDPENSSSAEQSSTVEKMSINRLLNPEDTTPPSGQSEKEQLNAASGPSSESEDPNREPPRLKAQIKRDSKYVQEKLELIEDFDK